MRKGYVDVGMESIARNVQRQTTALAEEATYENLRELAKMVRDLKHAILGHLEYYGDQYERKGLRFIEVAGEAKKAGSLVAERITRTDGGDRSAHALIDRSLSEICDHVRDTCFHGRLPVAIVKQINRGSSRMTAS